MLVSLDNLAHRYNCLPSEALERATTFDLMVLDNSTQWHNHKQAEEERRTTPKSGPGAVPQYSQEALLSIAKQVK